MLAFFSSPSSQTFLLLPWAVPTKTSPILLMTYMAEQLLVLDNALTPSKVDSFPDLVHLHQGPFCLFLSSKNQPLLLQIMLEHNISLGFSELSVFPNTKVANISFHNLLLLHIGFLPLPL